MAVEAKARLRLKSSLNTIEPTSENLAIIDLMGYGSFSAKFLGKKGRKITFGYTAGGNPDSDSFVTATEAGVLPYFNIFDVQNGQLVNQVSGPTIQVNEELDYSVGNTDRKRPYVAVTVVTRTEILPVPVDPPFFTYQAEVRIYAINNPLVLVDTYVLGSFDPINHPFVYALGQQFAGDFSQPNGNYLVYQFPATPDVNGDATEVRTGILRIRSNGTLVQVLEVTTSGPVAVGDSPPIISQLGIRFRRDCHKKHRYILVLTGASVSNSIFAGGGESKLETWIFNSRDKTLLLTGSIDVNQTILGSDLNYAQDRIILKMRMSDNGVTVNQVSIAPLNSVPGPYNELRLYKFNRCAEEDSLEYLSSENTNTSGSAIFFSHDDKFVATTSPSARFGRDPPNPPDGVDAGPYVPFSISSGFVNIFSFDKEKKKPLNWQYDQPCPPSSFGLDWSPKDKLLAVAGTETPSQKDTQLYAVVHDDCEKECKKCEKKEKCDCKEPKEDCGCDKEKKPDCGCDSKAKKHHEKEESSSESSSSSESD
jgi:hypothetical protein